MLIARVEPPLALCPPRLSRRREHLQARPPVRRDPEITELDTRQWSGMPPCAGRDPARRRPSAPVPLRFPRVSNLRSTTAGRLRKVPSSHDCATTSQDAARQTCRSSLRDTFDQNTRQVEATELRPTVPFLRSNAFAYQKPSRRCCTG